MRARGEAPDGVSINATVEQPDSIINALLGSSNVLAPSKNCPILVAVRG